MKEARTSNKETWERQDVVQIYAAHSELQKPEESILEVLRSDLAGMRMLDIGVGGGRTTLHFATLVARYVGIDCSERMIRACRDRFSDDSGEVSFRVCDVASMDIFAEHSFDFVLFSFNGIDCVPDREKAFREMRRVTRPGGLVCFSSHNLQSVHTVFRFDFRQFSRDLWRHPRKATATAREYYRLRFVHNPYTSVRKLKSRHHAVLNDGAHDYGLNMYYIKPAEQVRELKRSYATVRVFALSTGAEISNPSQLDSNEDPWLYYLCR